MWYSINCLHTNQLAHSNHSNFTVIRVVPPRSHQLNYPGRFEPQFRRGSVLGTARPLATLSLQISSMEQGFGSECGLKMEVSTRGQGTRSLHSCQRFNSPLIVQRNSLVLDGWTSNLPGHWPPTLLNRVLPLDQDYPCLQSYWGLCLCRCPATVLQLSCIWCAS